MEALLIWTLLLARLCTSKNIFHQYGRSILQAYIRKRHTPIQVFPVPNVYINSFVVCSCIICNSIYVICWVSRLLLSAHIRDRKYMNRCTSFLDVSLWYWTWVLMLIAIYIKNGGTIRMMVGRFNIRAKDTAANSGSRLASLRMNLNKNFVILKKKDPLSTSKVPCQKDLKPLVKAMYRKLEPLLYVTLFCHYESIRLIGPFL